MLSIADVKPHPNFDQMTIPELRADLERIDGQFAFGKEQGADEQFLAWCEQERNLIEATLKKRLANDGDVPDAEDRHTAFPVAAWTGLFARWRDMVAPCTEAALENLWAGFVIAVGLMLGRNVWMAHGTTRPLFPNFYVLLVGRTGDSRKSTVLWLTSELLRHIGMDEIEVLTGIVSTEGVFERLGKAERTRALGYADEFRSLLSVGKRQATQDLLPKLNSLYSCPAREEINRRQHATTIIDPFFSLITATAREYVDDLLTHLEVVGGTLNRFLIVSGPEQEPKPNVESPSFEQWATIARQLRHIRDRYALNPCNLEWDREAKDLWAEFYVSWRNTRKSWDARRANLTARTFEHILKLALVYATLSEEPRLSVRSLAIAISIGGWLEASALRVFKDVGVDAFTIAERKLLGRLGMRGKEYTRELQQWAAKQQINGKLFRDVIRTLSYNGHVRLGEETSLAGRKRPYVDIA